ncbi:MAG: hypothetical protein ACRDI0_12650 [Actinomycetota bacterium]
MRMLALGVVGVAYSLHDAGIATLPRLEIARQVPNHWRWRFPLSLASFLYGAGLGVGLATIITFSSFYLIPLWAILQQNWFLGALLFGAYGLARSVPLIAFAVTGAGSASKLDRLLPALVHLEAKISLMSGSLLAGVGLFFLISGVRLMW